MDDRNVLRHLRNDNDITWVCQFCGRSFPWSVKPKTFRHHLTRICESAPEDVKEEAQRIEELAVAAAEFSISVEGSRTASTSVARTASRSVASFSVARICESAPEDVKEAAQRIEELAVAAAEFSISVEGNDSNFKAKTEGSKYECQELQVVEEEVSSVKRTRREGSVQSSYKRHRSMPDALPIAAEVEVPMVEGIQDTGESASLTKRPVGDAFKRNEEKIWSWLMDDQVLRVGIYAMAEVALALLSPVISALIEKMVSVDVLDFFRRHDINEGQLQKLKVTLRTVTKVVGDAEQKQFTDRFVREWLDDLKDAAFKAEDFLDEVAYEVLKLKIESGGSQTSADAEMQTQNCTGQVRKFLGKMEPRLKEIHERLEHLVKQMGPLGLKEKKSLKLDASSPTTSLVEASYVYGRDGDKEGVVELLRSDDGIGMNVGVVLIVGMGGLGKTTLAQLVYKDSRVQLCFDVRAWVYVPKELEAFQVTRDIMKEVGLGKDIDQMTVNQMHCELERKLSGNKVLLVLDDVWVATQGEWDSLMKPFMSVKQGSKIIVTTRHLNVAPTMRSVTSYSLAGLNEDNCWLLFAKYAFDNESYREYPALEKIGREMVKKCNGLPLAAKALGGILRSERRVGRWKEILNNSIWASTNDEVLPALRLSYSYLPSSLKQCFAYCAMFPKNHPFVKEELVLLWVAEGFIAPSRREDMEMTGERYFEDLVSRSFLQQQSNAYGVTFFTMHDLHNDMATFVSREFCSRLEAVNSLEVTQRTRYLSYIKSGDDQNGIEDLKCILGKPHFLRTLFLTDVYGYGINLEALKSFKLLDALKSLRVLHLPDFNRDELLYSIGILKHLRYLSFYCLSGIQQLPESICKLYNLQILIMRGGKSLTKLPNNMRKLVNLFLLDISGTRLQEMPPHMGELTKLRRLSNFVVGKQKKAGSSSDIKELEKLHNLRGRLCVEGLQNVMDLGDVMGAILMGMQHLEELVLAWGHGEDDNNCPLQQQLVLEKLVPHSDLKSLSVYGYGGERFADWVGDSSFSCMVSLGIVNCKILSLPPVCRLASLERLTIESCYRVTSIGSELHSMKKLRYLSIRRMQEWCEWISDGDNSETNFPLLQELEIKSCPKLRKALPSHLPSVAKMVIRSCEQLEIECFSLECFPMLKELIIRRCPKLVSFCKGRSPNFSSNLASLSLIKCPNLEVFPESRLCSNLEILRIEKCPEIEFFPTNLGVYLGGSSSKLRELVVSHCKKLFSIRHEWGLEMLPSLLTLGIYDCDEVEESFPEKTLLLPSTLTTLCIINLPNLKSLNYDGLQPLTSLRELEIVNCDKLQSLQPNQNQKLPTSLSVLHIYGCPLLTERCQPEKGVDWPFISHIPHIRLDNNQVMINHRA